MERLPFSEEFLNPVNARYILFCDMLNNLKKLLHGRPAISIAPQRLVERFAHLEPQAIPARTRNLGAMLYGPV
jgi:hypothetical protein